MGEQVLDPGDAGGHLDHVVERTQLEHEVLEALGRGTQLDEHAPECLGDLTDLVYLPEAGHGGRRGSPGCRHRSGSHALPRLSPRHVESLAESPPEIGDALSEAAEEDVPEQGDGEGEEDADLRFGRLQEAEPPHEVHEDQQRQDGGQREDGARRFAEPHRMVTTGLASLSPSVTGAAE